MLYFSETPVKPELVSSKQYKQLQKFKAYCTPKGLYEGFASVEEFKAKFNRQLQIILREYFSKADMSVLPLSLSFDSKISHQLSVDEKRLLKAASLDSRGIIHRIRVSGGTYLETNKLHFIETQTAREIARWDAVLVSLEQKGYIKSVGFKGETFEITAAGFEAVDYINFN